MKSIKKIKTVRIFAKPFVDWKRKKDHDKYLRSPDHYYLQTLKGIHGGERCFIIGNGPSLRAADLDMLQGEVTFATNRIFKIFDQTNWRPTYYLSVDGIVLKDIQDELLSYDLGHMFIAERFCSLKATSNVLTRIYRDMTFDVEKDLYKNIMMYISEDVSNHFCEGLTVTFDAVQLAIYMGFKEIYLLGVDHNYSRVYEASGKVRIDSSVQDYFDNKKYDNTYPANLIATQYAYTIAREYCDAHGIKICNATRGGKLEVFERVDFDSLFPRRK